MRVVDPTRQGVATHEPEADGLTSAPPVPIEEAVRLVECWRANPGMTLFGLHQIAMALHDDRARLLGMLRAALDTLYDAGAQLRGHADTMAQIKETLVACKAEIERLTGEKLQASLYAERVADAAVGCSEGKGMACRNRVWFSCCKTRKRLCEAMGVPFEVHPPMEFDILRESGYVHALEASLGPRAPRTSAGCFKTDNFKDLPVPRGTEPPGEHDV